MLTLRDLVIMRQRHVRVPKHKTDVRINNDILVPPEVSRGHSKPATSSAGAGRTHKKDEGLNVRMAKKLGSL